MRRLLLSALLAAPAVIACSVLGGDDTASQEAEHREGDPTYAQYGWMWADESVDEFKENAANSGGWDVPEFVDLDHPMTQRLQFWVDAMDTALRTAHPDALKNTPKPKVIVRKDSEPNAWVSFLPVAWDVPSRIEADKDAGALPPPPVADDAGDAGEGGVDAAPPPPPPEATELMLDRNGNVSSDGSLRPFTRAVDPDKLGEFVKFANNGYARCQLSVQEGALWLGAGCTPKYLGKTTRGKRFAYYATAKYITFTTGYVFELLDEDRIVSTLAHEMGHFYRSHANMPTDVVNYFYSLDGGNHAEKPAPDPRYLDQTQKAREKLRNASGWGASFDDENALMAEKNLGFYTTEQEADEIALELVSLVGIPPGAAIDKVLAAQKAGEIAYGADTGAIKWADCAQLRDRGFKDDKGQWATVPVGDMNDPHHSWCFRAFNMQREIEAHRYKLGERPNPPGEPFSKLVTRLQNDVDPPTPIEKPDAGDAGAPPADAGGD